MSCWTSFWEKMPSLDEKILLLFIQYDGHIEDGFIGDEGDGWYHYLYDGDSMPTNPSHWMALPALPND